MARDQGSKGSNSKGSKFGEQVHALTAARPPKQDGDQLDQGLRRSMFTGDYRRGLSKSCECVS
ncbi:hypothetical protein C7B82_21070 [Stenomitos frigidus ULC18]|uniref:Uncharacterized protein n=1 Tax=Stenomitos frigidus ULC18 TaxID=2107698 RepID=A0A2T1DZS6_9CYAN|nr:hypothetical protein C7B82_21070 [Stenomitos frigidus ULC18]